MATISGRASRYGWQLVLQKQQQTVRTAGMGIISRSLALRETFADELEKSAIALGKVPYKSNLRELKKRAEVIEPLTRAAKTVFEWGGEKSAGLVVIGDMRAADLEAKPITQLSRPAEPAQEIKEIPLETEDSTETPGEPL